MWGDGLRFLSFFFFFWPWRTFFSFVFFFYVNFIRRRVRRKRGWGGSLGDVGVGPVFVNFFGVGLRCFCFCVPT